MPFLKYNQEMLMHSMKHQATFKAKGGLIRYDQVSKARQEHKTLTQTISETGLPEGAFF